MASWGEIMNKYNSTVPGERIKVLQDEISDAFTKITKITDRNIIAYYSAGLDNQIPNSSISETDKHAFMQAVYGMDKSKGLDLVLHTPGGDLAVTESIIHYLQEVFKISKNGGIRAIVPQSAMSAGSLIALSCESIIMGAHSSLGPVDPQLGGLSCSEVVEEFQQAIAECAKNPAALPFWQQIISKYSPTLLVKCEHGIKLADELAKSYIESNSFIDIQNVDGIINQFADHSKTRSHARRIPRATCKNLGLNILDLEDDNELQDSILTLHHCIMILLRVGNIRKIVLNNLGSQYIMNNSGK